ncbi:MAG: hypothetical protein ACLFP1_07650 [Candidatus Goldiibacteriota bacterium]
MKVKLALVKPQKSIENITVSDISRWSYIHNTISPGAADIKKASAGSLSGNTVPITSKLVFICVN